MVIPACLAIFSFVAAIWNLSQGDMANAVAGLLGAFLLGGFAFFLFRVKKGANEFLTFLAQNKERLNGGETVDYRGTPVTVRTEVTRFYFAVSLLVVSTKNPTGFYIRGRDNTALAGLMCSLMTLVLGWWGIPWGPIYSFQSVYTNCRGGKIQTVGQLLPQLQFVADTPGPSNSAPPAGNSTHSMNQSPWS